MAKGGYRTGAGRPGRTARIEDFRRLDVREFERAGMLRVRWAGRWQWREPVSKQLAAEVSVSTRIDGVNLRYHFNGVPFEEDVLIVRTEAGFGGKRAWFVCPGCQRRRAILLIRNGRFRCRECHDLKYRSQAQDPIGRSWLVQAKLERRLGPNLTRPKGMHHKTREDLATRVIATEVRRAELWSETCARLIRNLPHTGSR